VGITRECILDLLRTIPDPEMPISIVDLGIVEEVRLHASREGRGSVDVEIAVLPTFIGCPALDVIRNKIVERVSTVPGVGNVAVEFVNEPPWNVDRISAAGRQSLREHGVTVPAIGEPAMTATLTIEQTALVNCPFCGSTNTRLESPFGPTRCRSIRYCDDCRNSFEHMKRTE
jgi:ring-1,2-phenylacetyl-CoA epoxidase subunit PaaD